MSSGEWGPIVKRPARDRPLESTVLAAIREALAELPYVACWRNSAGHLKDVNGTGVTYGLAPGASDLILCVQLSQVVVDIDERTCQALTPRSVIGRMVGIEVKRDAKSKPTDDQLAWGRVLQSFGGYWGCAWTVAMALDHVERARRGEVGGPP